MNCEKCNVRHFVHSDIYCRGCPHKPQPRNKFGIAYFFRKDKSEPIMSLKIKAPAGMEYEVAALEFMKWCRIDFIESETILEEIR